MKKRALLAVLAAGAAIMLLAATSPLWRGTGIGLDGPAPDFRLPKLEGGLSTLSDFSGRVVLLDFWATWCKDCREEMPALERLHRKLKDRGFSIVAISLDEDGRRSVAPFVSRHGLTYPVLLSDRKTPIAYRVRGLPTAYLLDQKGMVIRRYVGLIEPDILENDILELLERRKTR
jgi:peroxiredoxin